MMQFAGICGTPLIIVSGFSGPLLEAFLSWRLAQGIPKRIDSEEWSRFIAESAHGRSLEPLAGSRLDYALTVAANFWTDCEAMMSAMPGRKGDIEFLIFPDQKQLYVHLELGPLTDFASDFYDALADRDGFVDWLLHGTIIPRRVYEVQMDGSKLEVTTLPADKIVLDVSSFDKEMFQTEPPCSSGCSPFVCSMLAATLMNYDKTHGVASAGLEEVVIKIYCVDAQGKPCP